MGIISEIALKHMHAMLSQAKFNSVDNTDEQALEVQSLYPEWASLADGTTLKAGDRVNYEGLLYNVLQEHQKQATWNPVDAPSLFAQVLIPDPSVVPEWVQPDSTNAYKKGDKVTHNGSTWESLVDGNVWEPGAVGTESLWKAI